MKHYTKGEPGYQRHHKLLYGLISLFGFSMVLTIFTVTYIYYGTPKNYFNILSVLIVLPTVKFFVQYLMIPWTRIDEKYYQELIKLVAPLPVYCELAITGSEKRYEVLYVVITPNGDILAYTPKSNTDCDAFRRSVINFLNYYNWDTNPTLSTSLEAYTNKVREACVNLSELTPAQIAHVEEIFSKLSIMSV